MMISLHTPKTAGITFRNLLSSHFGSGLFLDYLDFPINKSFKIRTAEAEANRKRIQLEQEKSLANIKCIHGHFLPYKYLDYEKQPNAKFITWLRDPLERLASHYYFWKRAYKKEKSAALHRKVVEESWPFEKFCFSKEMRNMYSSFIWNFPKETFDFIGITEFFDEDIRFFANNYLNIGDFEIESENINPSENSYYNDVGMVRELREWHKGDYLIYEYALSEREKRP